MRSFPATVLLSAGLLSAGPSNFLDHRAQSRREPDLIISAITQHDPRVSRASRPGKNRLEAGRRFHSSYPYAHQQPTRADEHLQIALVLFPKLARRAELAAFSVSNVNQEMAMSRLTASRLNNIGTTHLNAARMPSVSQ